MSVFTPYSGSLLRLAFTTVAILALFAAAMAYWQNYGGRAQRTPAFGPPSVVTR